MDRILLIERLNKLFKFKFEDKFPILPTLFEMTCTDGIGQEYAYRHGQM